MSALRRLWRRMLKPARPDAIEPVRPKVTPDPERAAALERRRIELTYYPQNGFHRDHRQPRSAQ